MAITRVLAIINLSDEDFSFNNEEFSAENGEIKSGSTKVLTGDSQRVPWMGDGIGRRYDNCLKLISKNRTRIVWQWHCDDGDRLRGANDRKFRNCGDEGAYLLAGDSRVLEDWETNLMITADYSIRSIQHPFKDILRVYRKEVGPGAPIVADHTWVIGSNQFCRGVTWGTNGYPDSDYCKDRWNGDRYLEKEGWKCLRKGSGSTRLAGDLALPQGKDSFIPFLPEEGGVIYGINGVCHTLTNRILYGTGLSSRGALRYGITQFLFGHYGTQVPIVWLAKLLGPTVSLDLLIRAQYLARTSWSRKLVEFSRKYKKELEASYDLKSSFLQRLDRFHLDLAAEMPAKQSLTLEELADVIALSNKHHFREINFLNGSHGANVPRQHRDALEVYAKGLHRSPSMDELSSLLGPTGTFNLSQDSDLAEHLLSSADIQDIANKLNAAAKQVDVEIHEILNADFYVQLYGREHDVDGHIINSDFIRK